MGTMNWTEGAILLGIKNLTPKPIAKGQSLKEETAQWILNKVLKTSYDAFTASGVSHEVGCPLGSAWYVLEEGVKQGKFIKLSKGNSSVYIRPTVNNPPKLLDWVKPKKEIEHKFHPPTKGLKAGNIWGSAAHAKSSFVNDFLGASIIDLLKEETYKKAAEKKSAEIEGKEVKGQFGGLNLSAYSVKAEEIPDYVPYKGINKPAKLPVHGPQKCHANTGHYDEDASWVKKWELDNMNLTEQCADFYVLEDLTIDYDDVKERLETKSDYLAGQFSRYLDMAVGGEFRHCHGSANGVDLAAFKKRSKLHELIVGKVGYSGKGRYQVWEDWYDIRNEYGLEALEVVVEGFITIKWSSSFGGKNWGRSAKVLHQYLKDELTKKMFVDTTWSLQHNCNIILDKCWNIQNSLKTVLDLKYDGHIDKVVQYASKEVKALWNEKKGASV